MSYISMSSSAFSDKFIDNYMITVTKNSHFLGTEYSVEVTENCTTFHGIYFNTEDEAWKCFDNINTVEDVQNFMKKSEEW